MLKLIVDLSFLTNLDKTAISGDFDIEKQFKYNFLKFLLFFAKLNSIRLPTKI